MGIVTGFTRVTAEEMDRAVADPECVDEILEVERSEDADLYLDKSLPDLDQLLSAAGVPVEFQMNGTPLFLPDDQLAWAWSVEEVRDAAEHLRVVTFDRLAQYSDDGPAELDYLRYYYENLVRFFVVAAEKGSPAIMSSG
jgi:hypothetical protein